MMDDLLKTLQEIAWKGSLCLLVALVFSLLTGCTQPAAHPSQSAQGYGAASTTTTDAAGNTVVTITPPTPAEEATALWVKLGAGLAVAGGLCLIPWGGGPHFRAGALLIGAGAGMAALGKTIGDIRIEIPVWFLPAFTILLTAGMLYGYFLKQQQLKDYGHNCETGR